MALETETEAVQLLMPRGATALVRTVLAAIGPAALDGHGCGGVAAAVLMCWVRGVMPYVWSRAAVRSSGR